MLLPYPCKELETTAGVLARAISILCVSTVQLRVNPLRVSRVVLQDYYRVLGRRSTPLHVIVQQTVDISLCPWLLQDYHRVLAGRQHTLRVP
jgi:hypothetical protein